LFKEEECVRERTQDTILKSPLAIARVGEETMDSIQLIDRKYMFGAWFENQVKVVIKYIHQRGTNFSKASVMWLDGRQQFTFLTGT
jgi:hypothetical protein